MSKIRDPSEKRVADSASVASTPNGRRYLRRSKRIAAQVTEQAGCEKVAEHPSSTHLQPGVKK